MSVYFTVSEALCDSDSADKKSSTACSPPYSLAYLMVTPTNPIHRYQGNVSATSGCPLDCVGLVIKTAWNKS
jgi:hypothetical protein